MLDDVEIAGLSSAAGSSELLDQIAANTIGKFLPSASRAFAVVITGCAACFGARKAVGVNRNENICAGSVGDFATCAQLFDVGGFGTLGRNGRVAFASHDNGCALLLQKFF